MCPFDLGEIQRTGIASHDEGAGQGHFWQRIETTFGDGPSTVREPFASSQGRCNLRVGLEALQFIERAQIGIVIVEIDNESQRDLSVFQMIEKGAARCPMF